MRLRFIAVCLLAARVFADTGFDVLPGPNPNLLRDFHAPRAAALAAENEALLAALDSPEAVAAWQERQRAAFIEALGGFPDRAPLNAVVAGHGARPGYRYEKVIFESVPGLHVTGVLYLPESGDGPFPGAIMPCGHAAAGKASEPYQRAAILLARHGIATLLYDPVGQGERRQYLVDGKPRYGATEEHNLLAPACIVAGTNVAMFRIWDGIRALDYLASRPDIDPDRLACTGNSGGGTLTSYLMALDPRIKAAAPSCYLTTFARLLDGIGPQDAEQNIWGQLPGMDHAAYILLRAPMPTLICAATRDFFEIEGTWETYRLAKRLYTRLGHPERVAIAEADADHGFSQPLREAAAHWLQRWLLGIDAPVRETDAEILTEEEGWCAPGGQVANLPGARTVQDLVRDRMAALAGERKRLDTPLPDRVRAALQWPEPGPGAARSVSRAPGPEWHGHSVEKVHLESDPGIALPAVLLLPKTPPRGIAVIAHGDGKAALLGESPPLRGLLDAGRVVLAVDLRGTGETSARTRHAAALIGADWQDAYRPYLFGESLLTGRVRDLVAAAQWLREAHPGFDRVEAHGVGAATVPVLHAAVIAPEVFGNVVVRDGPRAWIDLTEGLPPAGSIANAVHGVLAHYDLPDLVAASAARGTATAGQDQSE